MVGKAADAPAILVTVSGPDGPGITHTLTSIIAEGPYEIIDMGQSTTHGLLSLSILLGMEEQPVPSPPTAILKNLLFAAKNLGLDLDFKVVENSLEQIPRGEKYILCCVSAENIPPAHLRDVARTLADHRINILRIDNISSPHFRCLEITTTAIPEGPDKNHEKIKMDLIRIGQNYHVDLAYLKESLFRRNKRLIVLDMDSTLIATEVIDQMARVAGVEDRVKAITEAAMNGEINFDESLRQRVEMLRGLTKAQLEDISINLPLTPGAEKFLQEVQDSGYRVALISGGFNFFTQRIQKQFNLDYAFANELEFDGETMTGKLKGPLINAEQKAFLLELIGQQEKITTDQIVAVGDGANDLPMLAKAGLGIAFHAKDYVKERTHHHLSHGPMTTLLYFLGITPSTDI